MVITSRNPRFERRLLELQRLAGDAHTEVRDDLLRAALLAAVADFYARRARQRLRDGAARWP
jgi:hypothetical protein